MRRSSLPRGKHPGGRPARGRHAAGTRRRSLSVSVFLDGMRPEWKTRITGPNTNSKIINTNDYIPRRYGIVKTKRKPRHGRHAAGTRPGMFAPGKTREPLESSQASHHPWDPRELRFEGAGQLLLVGRRACSSTSLGISARGCTPLSEKSPQPWFRVNSIPPTVPCRRSAGGSLLGQKHQHPVSIPVSLYTCTTPSKINTCFKITLFLC